MTLELKRRLERIEVLFARVADGEPTSLTLQVRFIEEIIDTDTDELVTEKGFMRTSYDFNSDLSQAPGEIAAAAAAILRYRAAHPNA